MKQRRFRQQRWPRSQWRPRTRRRDGLKLRCAVGLHGHVLDCLREHVAPRGCDLSQLARNTGPLAVCASMFTAHARVVQSHGGQSSRLTVLKFQHVQPAQPRRAGSPLCQLKHSSVAQVVHVVSLSSENPELSELSTCLMVRNISEYRRFYSDNTTPRMPDGQHKVNIPSQDVSDHGAYLFISGTSGDDVRAGTDIVRRRVVVLRNLEQGLCK